MIHALTAAHRPTERATPPGGPVTGRLLGLVVAVVVPVAAVAHFASSSGFVWDDFLNFRAAQTEGLSLDYLLGPTSAHLAPGHRLFDWLLERLAPMNFGLALAVELVLFAASLVVFHRLLVALFGAGPGPLVLTLLYGASTVHVQVIQWWASGLDRVPATLASFVSMLAYVRFYRTGRRRSLALSVGALMVALLFYVKPVFVPLYLVLLRVLVLDREQRTVRQALSEVGREWRVWLAYAVPVSAYLVAYVSIYASAGQVHTPSASAFLRYMTASWFKLIAPSFFGLYFSLTHQSPWVQVVLVVVQVALGAALVWTVLRVPGAWRSWAILAVAFVANGTVVGLTRLGSYFTAEFMAYLVYYNLEVTYVFFLAVGAVVVLRHRSDGSRPEPSSARRVGPRVAVGLGVAAYLAFSWCGSSQISSPDVWYGSAARSYADRFEAGWRVASGNGSRAALVDGIVPNFVVPSLAGVYNNGSEVFPVIDRTAVFDPAGRDLFDVGGNGALEPVAFVDQVGGELAGLLAAGSASVAPGAVDRRDGSACIRPGRGPTVVGFTLPSAVGGGRLAIELHYTSATRQLMNVTVDPGGGGAITTRAVRLEPGRPQGSVWPTGGSTVTRVFFGLGPTSHLCLRDVHVGRLVHRP